MKSAYRSSSQHVNTSGLCESFWKKLGKIKTPKRIKMLLWRMGSNNLPTRDKLATRICILDLSCVLCGHSFESICHLFFRCPAARAIWFSTCWGLRSDQHSIQDSSNIVKLVLNPPSVSLPNLDIVKLASKQSTAFTFVLDEIWSLRNQAIFQN